MLMKTSDLLPPPRPFVPTLLAPPTKRVARRPKVKVSRPEFRSPSFGLFHRANTGRAVHRWETLVFLLLGLSGLVSIALAFLGF
jgi:hypothetical protein